MKKIIASTLLIFFLGCSNSYQEDETNIILDNNKVTSGEQIKFQIETESDIVSVTSYLKGKNSIEYEKYDRQTNSSKYVINRFLNKKIPFGQDYFLNFRVETENNIFYRNIPIEIEPSIIVKSFCASKNCKIVASNILQNVSNRIDLDFYKIAPIKVKYIIIYPNNTEQILHEYNSPVSNDWLENIRLESVKDEYSSYLAKIQIFAYDENNVEAKTEIPFRVVRPIEVKHFGKHELAEIFEPIPVTGCIPGSVGNNVQYSESTSETRQNSVGIVYNKSWSDSESTSLSNTSAEGISVNETESTVYSSSLTNSETQSESYTDTSSQGESNNLVFSSNDGENWSWSLGEGSSQTEGTSSSSSTNTGVNGSTTVGVSGEGSLPFLAKASGKVEVSAGIQRGWGSSEGQNERNTESTNRSFTTGGSSQNGRSFGSTQNDSRSHSLSGSYVLSNSTGSSISESSGLSSGRVWNMSESISSGKVITVGNSESISQTIVTSETNSTTFSYSGYIPRGRFGTFFRQTSRYVKLSEVITYSIDGIPSHAGYIMMNTWSWAPDLSIASSCEEALQSNLPSSNCIISPCGE